MTQKVQQPYLGEVYKYWMAFLPSATLMRPGSWYLATTSLRGSTSNTSTSMPSQKSSPFHLNLFSFRKRCFDLRARSVMLASLLDRWPCLTNVRNLHLSSKSSSLSCPFFLIAAVAFPDLSRHLYRFELGGKI